MLLAVAGFALFHDVSSPELEASPAPVEMAAPPLVAKSIPPQPELKELKREVQSGETITALLGDYFSPQEIHELNQRSRKVFPFTKICAGQPYKICISDGDFDSFVYEIDDNEQLIIRKKEDETLMKRVPIVYDVERELVQGVIKTSLFDAVNEIGEDSVLAIALADIFAWDIDFILDLRVGDTFQAMVEKRYREGQLAGYGRVLAAEFVNQKKVYRAFRFEDADGRAGYYDEEGRNVRKAFLKAPLSFTRISSGFTMKRFHPITKTWKAHPAIDYAAPPGTPIKTVGDGTIKRIGYTRGNGNFIEIRHSNGYSTLYLHMKGFARGMKRGKKLSQGQVIGYVGSTGLATGPHLCFRMRLNGKPVNPTKIKVPSSKSVAKSRMQEFNEVAAPFVVLFDETHAREMHANAQIADGVPVLESAQ
ncbi:Murein DD-endopeptidase MepM and murein hydrolase activator NlpD, contain LysM domain [Malonomonas rubra DSM 5091]|uniref:Murein DD-endopeptidase MepM and murein hydrolase activator NlpD, contain LysM domain n=2 Tax=Malonomonas rubra TaxID=57040 RepID=A0A1M6BH34_MALRU|nr:Murein DD-endopeptidase MepM and murein hydrolase activator NlpD, contain LysM domain [Malonomonas rubra DSM 5091]